jgi:hypothetical protein
MVAHTAAVSAAAVRGPRGSQAYKTSASAISFQVAISTPQATAAAVLPALMFRPCVSGSKP